MDSIDCAKQRIREIIAGSRVPEDPIHAENTLEWLLKLDPAADQALQIAVLAHDIDRAVEVQKVRRADFTDYDAFKAEILDRCGVAKSVADEACRLVTLHEVGGDPRSDLLKDADSISYFEVNLPWYYRREGREETKRRCRWGYQRLSARMKAIVKTITHEDESISGLLKEVICEQNQPNYDFPG
jgi:hypothetical protein